jgi:hypothetical protein
LTIVSHSGDIVFFSLVQVLAITSGVLKMEDGIAGFGSIHPPKSANQDGSWTMKPLMATAV